MAISPHVPDFARLKVEKDLTEIIAPAVEGVAEKVQVAYFAAFGKAIVMMPVSTCDRVWDATRKASQALCEKGFRHIFENDDQGPALHRTDYEAKIVVRIP